jgi:hypothetical protein
MTSANVTLNLNPHEAQVLYNELTDFIETFWDYNDPYDDGDMKFVDTCRTIRDALEPFVMSIDDQEDCATKLKGE